MCSVHDPRTVLDELGRILRPRGKYGLAPDPSVRRWQRRIDPLSTRLRGNCHMSREVSGTFEHPGFETRCLGADYVPGVPRYAGWVEWGTARARHTRKNPLGRMGIISVGVNHAHPTTAAAPVNDEGPGRCPVPFTHALVAGSPGRRSHHRARSPFTLVRHPAQPPCTLRALATSIDRR
jgi:hypothetical protein